MLSTRFQAYLPVVIFTVSGCAFLLAMALLFVSSKHSSVGLEPVLPPQSDTSITIEPSTPSRLSVDIAGAVINPGLYFLDKDTHLADAINAAGGFHKKVDQVYVSRHLNIAKRISDEEKIYIPFVGEQMLLNTSIQSSKFNLNTATQSQLESLASVGEKTAQKILENRPYSSLDELMTKEVISEAVFEKIQDNLTL